MSSSSTGLLLYRFFATLENDSKAAVRSEGSRAEDRGGVSHPAKTQTNLSEFTDECRLIIRLPLGGSCRGTRLMRVAAKRRGTNIIENPNTRTSSVGYAATFPKGKAQI